MHVLTITSIKPGVEYDVPKFVFLSETKTKTKTRIRKINKMDQLSGLFPLSKYDIFKKNKILKKKRFARNTEAKYKNCKNGEKMKQCFSMKFIMIL